MHGRVKVRTTAEQEASRKVERAKKLARYRAGIAIVFQKRKDKIWDEELLSITERMLAQNPDIYTLWNVRREAFENTDWNARDYERTLERELALTESCLKENPKSYGVWHQRCWVTERTAKPDWKRELSLCAKCLDLDERNFHCWDYRRRVVEKARVPDMEEFHFSTAKILSNFSNYSSWHYRSNILSRMFANESAESPVVAEKYREELKLVMDATFTDPNDSSAWFYQRWLLNDHAPSPELRRALVANDQAVVAFRKDVCPESAGLRLRVDDEKVHCRWDSYGGGKFSKLWFTDLAECRTNDLRAAAEVSIDFREHKYRLHRRSHADDGDDDDDDDAWILKTDRAVNTEPSNVDELREQLKCYRDLAEMEPNNKWALLTGVFLMKKIDPASYHDVIMNSLETLTTVDALRSNYYKDLRSKCLLEYYLRKTQQSENGLQTQSKIDLSELNLTTLRDIQYLSFFREVNLHGNRLGDCLDRLAALRTCESLTLSSNQLKSLKRFPRLPRLRSLCLRNNQLTSIEEISDLASRHNLIKLDLAENPICKNSDVVSLVNRVAPNLEICTT